MKPRITVVAWAILGTAVATGCAQNRDRPAQASEDAHVSTGLQNYKKRAPMNDREIPNGPGVFSGQEGAFVIFRN